jgi:16S rRNA (adenine1518-N6/adenine1519-N6)-dimethyltransferase
MWSAERVDIVDENDRVIQTDVRANVKDSDILRAAVVFIMTSDGRVVLQLRSKSAHRYPSHWDCSAGGHVMTGETYAQAALRELEEELGITCELEHLGTQLIELSDGRQHHCAFFLGAHDGPYDIQRDELDSVRAFTPEELRTMIAAGEAFHPDCLIGLETYVLT